MARVLGKDILDFFDNHWPEGYYYDDYTVDIENVNVSEKYNLADFGILVNEINVGDTITFTKAFNNWFKKKDITTLIFIVPNGKVDIVRSAVENILNDKSIT